MENDKLKGLANLTGAVRQESMTDGRCTMIRLGQALFTLEPVYEHTDWVFTVYHCPSSRESSDLVSAEAALFINESLTLLAMADGLEVDVGKGRIVKLDPYTLDMFRAKREDAKGKH